MESDNAAVIRRLYEALDARDGEAMAACYTPDARFTDPVFLDLEGREVGAMWRMLCQRSDDLSVELVDHGAKGKNGWAHWVATYTFTQTGRPVVNDVQAAMRFRDGLIAEHWDSFNLHRWTSQALGTPGRLLGWTPLVKRPVRRRARESLDEFLERDAG